MSGSQTFPYKKLTILFGSLFSTHFLRNKMIIVHSGTSEIYRNILLLEQIFWNVFNLVPSTEILMFRLSGGLNFIWFIQRWKSCVMRNEFSCFHERVGERKCTSIGVPQISMFSSILSCVAFLSTQHSKMKTWKPLRNPIIHMLMFKL